MKKHYAQSIDASKDRLNPSFQTQLIAIKPEHGVDFYIDGEGNLQLSVRVERLDRFEGPMFSQEFYDFMHQNKISSTALDYATDAVYDAFAEVANLEALLLASRRS